MKIYKTITSLFIICLALSSCRSVRQVTQTKETVSENSKIKVINYRDTVLFTPKSATGLSLPLTAFSKCNEIPFKDSLKGAIPEKKPKVWSQQNGNAKVKVEYIHDTIKVTAECDSIALSAKIKQELQSEYNSKNAQNSLQEQKTTGYTFYHLIIAFAIGFVAGIISLMLLIITKKT